MAELRNWQLDSSAPYSLQIAADARYSHTDYLNDQIWELTLGTGDAPALALQTRYGGRVGLASLVPMWQSDGRMIYQAQTYVRMPIVRAFAPGYLQVHAQITTAVSLIAEYWVMESQSVSGRYILYNSGPKPTTLHLDLFGHVVAQRKDLPLAVMSLIDETHALSLGRLSGLEPVVVMENATAQLTPGEKASPKIGSDIALEPGETASIRWVHTGLARMESSLERAQFWLKQDWDVSINAIRELTSAIPRIETGDAETDAVIAFAYQQSLQAFLQPTGSLPESSFVMTRQPSKGFSRRGDGSDYDRGWNGQFPPAAYLLGTGLASVAPEFAQGIILNYLAVQEENGAIDMRPGIAGQKQGLLLPPILARLTWEIYRYTENVGFLAEVFPGLMRFFNRWSESDLDIDGDMLPEWQDERQMGYMFWPTFGAGQPWAQNADIRQVESPDIVAYLLSEAKSLKKIGQAIGNISVYELDNRIETLERHLERLWDAQERRFSYRDRDSGVVATRITILQDVPADEEHLPAFKLAPAARLIVHVMGGTSHIPRAVLTLEGIDQQGNKISESATQDSFAWSYGNGVYTSRHLYAVIDKIRFDGLSRVYKFSASTLDLSRLDVNALIPLWIGSLSTDKAAKLVELISDPSCFLRESGLTIVSASDENFDPSSANGGGGVWPYWTSLIGEGLLDHGYVKEAAVILRKLLDTQVAVLKRQNRFSEFYHADNKVGLGEDGFITGIVPLHLLMRLLGIRIVNTGHVYVGGEFVWDNPVTVTQYGVQVVRSEQGTSVTFASGYKVNLSPNSDFQEVIDPSPRQPGAVAASVPIPPGSQTPEEIGRVIIQLNHEDETSDS